MRDKKMTIRLREGRDDMLIAAIDSIPPGQREPLIRRALAWYLVPGGFHDLEEQLRIISGSSRPIAQDTAQAAPYVPDPLAVSEILDQAMKDFGWDDDDE